MSGDRASARTFVVTGAASGIGLATARRPLADGGTVVGADLTAPDEELGARFDFVAADGPTNPRSCPHSPRYQVDSTGSFTPLVSQAAGRSICSTAPSGSE